MFKRVVWFGSGVAAGAGGAVWAQRKVRAQLDRARPTNLAVAAGERARSAGGAVRDAVTEGRSAARQREVELRQRYERPRGVSSGPR